MLLPKIEVDENLPPGTIELREPTQEFRLPLGETVRVKGRLLGKIVNVGTGPKTLTPRSQGDMIFTGDGDDLRQTVKLLRWLKTRKPQYYGKVTVSFERGEIVHLRQEHSVSIRRGDVDRMDVEDL